MSSFLSTIWHIEETVFPLLQSLTSFVHRLIICVWNYFLGFLSCAIDLFFCICHLYFFVPVPYLVTEFFLGWSTILLLNQPWVCLPACSKTNLLTPSCGEGGNSIDCKVPDRAIRGVSAENIQISLVGFRETFYRQNWWRGLPDV